MREAGTERGYEPARSNLLRVGFVHCTIDNEIEVKVPCHFKEAAFRTFCLVVMYIYLPPSPGSWPVEIDRIVQVTMSSMNSDPLHPARCPEHHCWRWAPTNGNGDASSIAMPRPFRPAPVHMHVTALNMLAHICNIAGRNELSEPNLDPHTVDNTGANENDELSEQEEEVFINHEPGIDDHVRGVQFQAYKMLCRELSGDEHEPHIKLEPGENGDDAILFWLPSSCAWHFLFSLDEMWWHVMGMWHAPIWELDALATKVPWQVCVCGVRGHAIQIRSCFLQCEGENNGMIEKQTRLKELMALLTAYGLHLVGT